MTFKQNAKMKAEGNHFCGGGRVKKYETGGSVKSVTTTPIGDYAAEKAHQEYAADKKNWPLNPKQDAINSANAREKAESWDDAPKKKRGGSVRRKK